MVHHQRVSFAVLGSVQVFLEGTPRTPIHLRGKPRAVLATLLLNANTVISRDGLVAALWDEPPTTAVANIQTHVWQLRRAIPGGDQIVRTEGSGYLLCAEPDQLDALIFSDVAREGRLAVQRGELTVAERAFGRAVALWRGRPAEDLVLGEVLTPRIAELEEELYQARSDWIDVRLALGQHDQLIGELRKIADAHPLRERLWGQLMLALHRAGRRGEALDAYRRVRTVLVEELGVEPGADLRSLHASLLADHPSAHKAPEPATAPHGPAVPDTTAWHHICQLPADLADFVGRSAELKSITTILRGRDPEASAPVIVALSGTPGLGKSTLAIHLAHLLRPAFPDGQLYVRLGAASPAPRDPRRILGELLRALGVEGSAIPDTLEERAALYRSRLADREILIILDDAAEEAQVSPLLPGTARGAVLVTSRAQLALPGAQAILLDVPDENEAVELLERVAGQARVRAEPKAAASILRACGRLPLAIRIAAARLSARPAWPLSDFAARLEDTRRRLDELALGQQTVRANFAVSYDALTDVARRTFRLLGLSGLESVPEWAAAALLGESRDVTDRALETLVVAGLVNGPEACAAGGLRYRLHDLLRAFAREQAEAEESETRRRAILLGLVRESLDRVAAAVGDLPLPCAPMPGAGESRPATGQGDSEWLMEERGNMVAVVELAAALDRPALAGELAYHLTAYLRIHGFFDQATRIHDAVIAAATRLEHTPALLTTRLLRADLLVERGMFGDALREFESLLELFERMGDRHSAAYALSGLGICRHVFGDFEEALDRTTEAVDRFEELGDHGGLLSTLIHLTSIHLELGHHDQAAEVCRRGLELARGGRTAYPRAILLRALGITHYSKGEVTEAIRRYEESLELSRRHGYPIITTLTERRLGEALGAVGRFDEAVRTLTHCQRSFARFGDTYGETLTAYALGEVAFRRHRAHEALRHLTHALDVLGVREMQHWRARVLREIGRVHADLGDPDAALAAWNEALAIFHSFDSAEAAEVSAFLDTLRPVSAE
ncbi:BTAD domain-containing putative transcriptional regulator [Nonomuraea sp. NEAU-A123]|uniref:AfsR/SARP family transcriptional regulator n=1 Tax=Nonomuraea sp. NEAU-A123 TaxID=2839649 RepID=UPI001BE435EE|nr:BTAD domain-containing putative transcriptional regulator [Nonomuraea sp. NEAU-A123]MBT2226462.1 tetratricopeptide repeat protein [Nonomuraea sp. NEAU-A123]